MDHAYTWDGGREAVGDVGDPAEVHRDAVVVGGMNDAFPALSVVEACDPLGVSSWMKHDGPMMPLLLSEQVVVVEHQQRVVFPSRLHPPL